MKHFITFIFCFSLFIYIKSDLLDKLEHVINDKNVIFDEIHTDVDNSLKDSLKDESKTKLINTTNQTIKDDSIISYQNNRVNKDDQQITSNISNTYNNSNNNHSIQISQNNIPINSQNLNMNINYNTNDNVANNYQMQAGATDYNQMNNSNLNNYNNGINSYENFKNQAEFNQNMNNPAIFSSNSLDNPINNQKNSVPYSQIAPQNTYSYSNFPTTNTPNNYQINNLMQNNGISHPYFREININNNELPDENSDIIFDHLFIDMNGEKELPYMKSKWTFDQINNEFILPEESKYYVIYL